MKSPLTTHVLDTARGRPAAGVAVTAEIQRGDGWQRIGGGTTDDDGRVAALLPDGVALEAAVYRLRFATAAYFVAAGVPAFYPEVQIAFRVAEPAQHHHVPLLLSPFGYSTYRGS